MKYFLIMTHKRWSLATKMLFNLYLGSISRYLVAGSSFGSFMNYSRQIPDNPGGI